MNSSTRSRRYFLQASAKTTAALSIGSLLPGISAASYRRISGANNRIRVAMMGVNSRGEHLARSFAKQADCEVAAVCDVDSRAAQKCITSVQAIQKTAPIAQPDFRKALADKAVDVLAIAAPDHWHAPAAIMASQAGKHVYLEKPCSHNPREGELLMEAQAKYKNFIQMGNQRRSSPTVMKAMEELRSGVIGNVYTAKTWYVAAREAIGFGKEAAVPNWLDYELWQGPAPRRPFRDNLVHYNWHWFWNWGTGEALNNGTHMVDLARWGLGVDYPTKVYSTGGRYHFKDDWETPDTQFINMQFGPEKSIVWEGHSCTGKLIEGGNVGVMFLGDKGALHIDGSTTYKVYNKKNELVREVKTGDATQVTSLSNPTDNLDGLHIKNLLESIRGKEALTSDIGSGHKSTLLVQLGNISLRTGSALDIDPSNGRIKGNKEAMKYWSREYAKGWEPKV